MRTSSELQHTEALSSSSSASSSSASTIMQKDNNNNNDSSTLRTLLKLILFAFSAASISYLFSKKGYIWFSLHFICMILGFILLPGVAILIKKAGGYVNTRNHGYLMSGSVLLVCFGFYVIYSNKVAAEKEHFTTLHGQLGLAVTVLYIGMALFGYPALNPDDGIFKTNKTVRFAHKWTGRIATALAWICCIYGFNTVEANSTYQLVFAVPLLLISFFVLL